MDWAHYFEQGASSATLADSTTSSNGPRGFQQSPTSPYAPRLLSVSDNSWVREASMKVVIQ